MQLLDQIVVLVVGLPQARLGIAEHGVANFPVEVEKR